MISRELKSLFYVATRWPMRWNAALYRRYRAPKSGDVKVHLGPGIKNYVQGWINVDANLITAKIDVWADLANPLPFRDGSVDAFYSHHVIEHLPDPALSTLFGEMHRCLKPAGVIRVGGPDGDSAIRKFVEGDTTWFNDWPDKRASVGGRFANFVFCRGEHVTILTRSYLTELAEEAKFADVGFCLPATQTSYPNVIGSEILSLEAESTPEVPHTVIMEARKVSR